MDFWRETADDMKLMLKEQLYPPKSSLVVYTNRRVSLTAAVTVEVKGTKDNEAAKFTIIKDFNAGVFLSEVGLSVSSPFLHVPIQTEVGV